MSIRYGLLGVSLALLLSLLAMGGGETDCPGSGPDVVVSEIFDSFNWGNEGGEIAFTIGTNACNISVMRS